MALEAFDDDDTNPAPCGCATCLERLRLTEALAAAHITRMTSVHAPLAKQGKPWTVYLEAGPTIVEGRGDREEEAIEAGLAKLREGS